MIKSFLYRENSCIVELLDVSELPLFVSKRMGGSCTQVGNRESRRPARPKASHAQPP